MIVYALRREQIEHARLRALAQAIVNREKAVEAFDQYHELAFPWLAAQKRRDQEESIRLLRSEIGRGALSVRPMVSETAMRSRLKARTAKRSGPET